MRTHRLVLSLILRPAVVTGFACLAILAAGGVVRAQNPVTTTDLTRLDTTADDIAKRADALKTTDPTLATDVTKSLADLRDDITYLKVKLRRGEPVSRDEYTTLHDKLETLRVRAQGEKVTAQPVLPPAGRVLTVQVGTQLDVRLQTPLNSGTTKVEQRFEATTLLDLKVNDEVVVPAGSVVRGFVSSVSPAGRLDRRGSMTLSFDQVGLASTT